MAIETLSANVVAIHAQVDATLRGLCGAAERIRRISSALEKGADELFRDSPAEALRQAGAAARAHAMSVLISTFDVAGKAECLELLAGLYESEDSPPPTEPARSRG